MSFEGSQIPEMGRFPLSVTRDRIVDAGDGPGRSFALFFIRLSHAPWNVTRSAKGISRGITIKTTEEYGLYRRISRVVVGP